MNVLVFEPLHTGHRYNYISMLASELVRLGFGVELVLSDEGTHSEEFKVHLEKVADDIPIQKMNLSSAAYSAKSATEQLDQCLKKLKPDYLFVPVGDGISQQLGWNALRGRKILKSISAETLHFQGGFGYSTSGIRETLKRKLSRYLVRRAGWDVLHHLDQVQLEGLGPLDSEQWKLLPDPVSRPIDQTQSEAREHFGLGKDRKIVGCFGNLNRRKGIHFLIDAFAEASNSLDDAHQLVLLGRYDSSIEQVLSRHTALLESGRIVAKNVLLSNSEFELAFKSCDVMAAPYPRHFGSSSIVIKAAAYGLPVLAADFGWIERTVRQFKLGVCLDVSDLSRFADLIIETFSSVDDFYLNDQAKKFVRYHSKENFLAHWTRRIRQKAGLDGDPELLEWSQVVG